MILQLPLAQLQLPLAQAGRKCESAAEAGIARLVWWTPTSLMSQMQTVSALSFSRGSALTKKLKLKRRPRMETSRMISRILQGLADASASAFGLGGLGQEEMMAGVALVLFAGTNAVTAEYLWLLTCLIHWSTCQRCHNHRNVKVWNTAVKIFAKRLDIACHQRPCMQYGAQQCSHPACLNSVLL